jgi:predicted ferric reductase
MLQRLQTLWTLAAAACAVLTLKFSFFSGNKLEIVPPAQTQVRVFHHLTATGNILLLILTVIIIIVGVVNIFNYKNRKLQFRLTLLLILISLLDIFLYYRETMNFAEGSFALTSVLALAIPVFLILAARGISRDEKIVKGADRLR